MSETKRKFWQFHLSTAALMMLLSAVLMWVNLRQDSEPDVLKNGNTGERVTVQNIMIGWPYCVCYGTDGYSRSKEIEWIWNSKNILKNCAIAIAIITGIGVSVEYLSRKLAVRRFPSH